MAKLSPAPMTDSEMLAYVNGNSDISFEMQVLEMMNGLPYKCEHGGTYRDPLTGKAREYDIRATAKYSFSRFYLAIECKNLRANSPLLAEQLWAGRETSADPNEVLSLANVAQRPRPLPNAPRANCHRGTTSRGPSLGTGHAPAAVGVLS